MRFSHLTVFALSSFAIANPIISKRATEDAVSSLLTDLYAQVQIYTGAINATLAPLSPSSNLVEKTAATAQVGSQINLISSAIRSSTSEIRDLPPTDLSDSDVDIPLSDDAAAAPEDLEKRQLLTVGVLLGLIVVEIFATISGAVAILGLAGLLIYLNPLTGALAALIVAVQVILNVVLVGVLALLNGLLAGLALGLISI